MEHGFNQFIPDGLNEHLKEEAYSELCEIGEINQMQIELENKANRRVRRIHSHMRQCGTCLSEQMKAGILMELPEYWQMRHQTGGGRYPKLHYQVN